MHDTDHRQDRIQPANGKLGVMIAGMGAVATSFVAGVEAVRQGLARPVGSLTQMATIRLGKRTEARCAKIKEFVPLADLNDLVFTGWDIFTDDMYAAACKAGVLDRELLDRIRPFLESITPRTAVFNRNYVRKLDGRNVKAGRNKMRLAEQLRADIREFRQSSGASRLIVIWCGSTETFLRQAEVHESLKAFERGLEWNDENISPSMIYAYAALSERVPFANGAPNLTADIPAMYELSRLNEAPICGREFKTGHALVKTILAPGFKARMPGLHGWYSTNILGNRDGEVLDDPESFKTKEVSKLGVLEHILQPQVYPELYREIFHKVGINYSILAALIVLDLVLFLDLAQRCEALRGIGIQEWLSFYFKSPMTVPGLYPEHDLFNQFMKLKNTLRHLKGEQLITHLG